MTRTEDNLSSMLDWYTKRYSIRELKNADEIVTPFTNHLNDRISIYIEYLSDQKIRISDDGVTLDELSMMGLSLSSPTRQKILKNILKNYELSKSDDTIFTIATSSAEFPQKQHNLLQGLLSIYDILFTSRENSLGIFNEAVQEYLFDNDFGGTPNPKLVGASGLTHTIDYSLGATKIRPFTLFKFLTNPNFNDVAAQQYISEDLKISLKTSAVEVKYVIIANDSKKNIPQKSLVASSDMGIELVPWSDKDRILNFK